MHAHTHTHIDLAANLLVMSMKRKEQVQQQSVTKRAKAHDVDVDVILPGVIWRLIIEMLPAKQWMQLLFINTVFNRITRPLSTKCRELWDICRYVCV
jgi:hypothetical protein